MRTLTKEIVNQKRFKITESGTFTIEKKDIISSDNFKKLRSELKPASELKKQ